MRRILICPNAFKGSLTAVRAAEAIAEGVAAAGADRQYRCMLLPLADGGDGTLETLVNATGGEQHHLYVRGPLGVPVNAAWGRLGGDENDTAVIEMAAASGLQLLSNNEQIDERDALHATTYGTGELMRAAIDAGCRKLVIGIGGSATTDGGAGMAQALGFRLLDKNGVELPPGGGALERLARIDTSSSCLPTGMEVTAACDVDNPLIGPEGAAAVYGPQKGADPKMVVALDAGLRHLAEIWRTQLGADISNIPGAGAAGGLGGGLMAFCNGVLRPGADLVLDLTRFEGALRTVDFVVTGEGRLDGQTTRGKLVATVARRARDAGKPVIALAGSIAPGTDEELYREGLSATFCIMDGPMTVGEAMADAYRLLAGAAERMIRLLELRLPETPV